MGILHKLFRCPTFWKLKATFECPLCGRKYRCYWDGHNIKGHGTDICKKCARAILERPQT
jgi:phage/plasmid primase-like uncharacterized protein